MTLEEHRSFLCNPENVFNCEDCPENIGASDWQGAYPCGQWHCWVSLHTTDEDE